MENDDERYTAGDAVTANSVLRAALGLPPERFGTAQFVGMISDEIEQLRRAGKSDAQIAQLLSDGGGIDVSADSIGKFYAPPDVRRRPD